MKKILLSIGLMFLSLGQVNATVMTFNGTASDGSFTALPGSHSESGFTMTNNSGTNYFLDNGYSNLVLNPWDDDVLEFDSLTTSKITFTANGGGIFNFDSAYLGSLNSAASLTLKGFFDGGGSISQTVLLALNTRSLFNFSGFDNLSSLVVSGPVDGNFAIMDDFTFNESTSIPEPASLALLGLGLTGLGFSRKRKAT